jgi:hypothetical protein
MYIVGHFIVRIRNFDPSQNQYLTLREAILQLADFLHCRQVKNNEGFYYPDPLVHITGALLAPGADHAVSFSPRLADPASIQNRRVDN